MIANLDELKSLPVSERLALISDLWDSINDEKAELPPFSEETLKELDRRVAYYEKHPESGRTWEQVMSTVRARCAR